MLPNKQTLNTFITCTAIVQNIFTFSPNFEFDKEETS